MESIGRLLPQRPGGFFLFGPRGTGKSTWLRSVLPDAIRVDLLDPEAQRLYQARPERLRELEEAYREATGKTGSPLRR